MMHNTMKHFAIDNGYAQPIILYTMELWNFPWQTWNSSEERHYRSNSLRILAIGLKFGEMMHSAMNQIAL